jgi:hypothetical protein
MVLNSYSWLWCAKSVLNTNPDVKKYCIELMHAYAQNVHIFKKILNASQEKQEFSEKEKNTILTQIMCLNFRAYAPAMLAWKKIAEQNSRFILSSYPPTLNNNGLPENHILVQKPLFAALGIKPQYQTEDWPLHIPYCVYISEILKQILRIYPTAPVYPNHKKAYSIIQKHKNFSPLQCPTCCNIHKIYNLEPDATYPFLNDNDFCFAHQNDNQSLDEYISLFHEINLKNLKHFQNFPMGGKMAQLLTECVQANNAEFCALDFLPQNFLPNDLKKIIYQPNQFDQHSD